MNLFNKVQDAVVNIINTFVDGIALFRKAIGADGCGIECQFNKLKDAILDLPNNVIAMNDLLVSLGKRLNDTAHPIANVHLRKIVQAYYGVYKEAYDDINRMYTLAFDTITKTIPELVQNVTKTVLQIVEAIKALPDCPNAAAYALLDAKDKIQGYIALIFVLKGEFEDAFFIRSKTLPSWLNPTKELLMIIEEFPDYLIEHFEIIAWDCDNPTPFNPDQCLGNRTYYDEAVEMNVHMGRLKPVADILAFVQNRVMPQITDAITLYEDVRAKYEKLKAL